MPGVVGLLLIALWGGALLAPVLHAAPVDSAYQASLTAMADPDPLADPPRGVALVNLQVGIMLLAAFPAVATAVALGLTAVLLHRGRGRALLPSWTAIGTGGLGAFPALGAFVVGLAMSAFNGLVVS